MKIHITGRHLQLTKSLKEHIEAKVSKAQKYFTNIVWAQVMVSVEKYAQQAEIIIHAAGQTFRALARAATLYAAVDLAADKMENQLRKHKERLKGRHKAAPTAAEIAEAGDPGKIRFSVIKDVPLAPLSVERAADEMDRLGYTFWMFQDADSGRTSVIYRRQDDSLGLLRPAKRSKKDPG